MGKKMLLGVLAAFAAVFVAVPAGSATVAPPSCSNPGAFLIDHITYGQAAANGGYWSFFIEDQLFVSLHQPSFGFRIVFHPVAACPVASAAPKPSNMVFLAYGKAPFGGVSSAFVVDFANLLLTGTAGAHQDGVYVSPWAMPNPAGGWTLVAPSTVDATKWTLDGNAVGGDFASSKAIAFSVALVPPLTGEQPGSVPGGYYPTLKAK